MMLFIFISFIIINLPFSIKSTLTTKNSFNKNELNLNLLPSTKYKISNSDYQRLKNEIEIQTLSKLFAIQRNYDTREHLRSLYTFQPHLLNNNIPLLKTEPVQIQRKNISPNMKEVNTYLPTTTAPKKGYTIHISEEQIKELLAMKKELENEIALKKNKYLNEEDNIRSIGNDMVLSPSLTENGENIVINTKTNEIGKIVKMNHDDSIEEIMTREEDNELLNEINKDYNRNNTLFKQITSNNKNNNLYKTDNSSSILFQLIQNNNQFPNLSRSEFNDEYNSLSKTERDFLSSLIKSNMTTFLNSTNL